MRPLLSGGLFTQAIVSIHAPTRGATSHCKYNTCFILVSIHAPTRGATLLSGGLFTQDIVSIHAPTRGATHIANIIHVLLQFQSTHPHGVRREDDENYALVSLVSIHAPTRGATTQPKSLHI